MSAAIEGDTTTPPREATGDRNKEIRRVAAATFIGTTLEWYDFYLYAACAALVFGPLFFPGADPLAGQLGALATFAVGFVARPLGGAVAGHFGDRWGRKRMLVITLMVMGLSTVAVGVLPTYDSAGALAPILLVVLRILQGLAMGGEWGGAVSMAVEHAPPHRRAFYASAPMMGSPAGLILANVVLLGLVAATGESFTTWGWRLGFLSSIVLVALGFYIRRQVSESPLFDNHVAAEPERIPLVQIIRRHPGALIKTLVVAGVPGISTYMVLTYTLTYGTTVVDYSRQSLLVVGIAVCAVQLVLLPLAARIGDRSGTHRLVLVGTVLQGLAALLFFPLFDTGNFPLAVLASIVAVIPTVLSYAALPTVLSDQFPAKVRYTGISMAYQLGAIVGGGIAPIIATAIFAATGVSFLIGMYMAAANVIALAFAFLLRGRSARSTGTPVQHAVPVPDTA
ncbi:MFS transporter [Streptomyces acidicola]|uniref:MFS transporter n=1 Tax=Streptomyces acidicola TaxID=2596892 RepID=UPI003828A9E3